MNATTTVTFAAIIGTVFLILMCVSTIVGSILFFAGRPRSGVRRAGGSMVLVCGGILTMGFIGGLFLLGWRSVSTTDVRVEASHRMQKLGHELHEQHSVVSSPTSPPPSVPPAPPHPTPVSLKAEAEANVDAGLTRLPEAEQPVDATLPQAEKIEPISPKNDRPAWIATTESRLGDVRHLVLSSKQYATLEEARQELASAAKSMLADDSLRIFHTDMMRQLQSLSVSQLRSLAVKQEHAETTPTDFGNFTAPMHRVWWQVELSPEVRTKLRAIWKEQTQDQRTWTVAGTLGGITALFAGLSLLTRRRHAVMG